MMHWGDFVADKAGALGGLVIGIDPVWEDIPDAFKPGTKGLDAQISDYVAFILHGAAGQAGFVKFQAAFFEAFGIAGLVALSKSMRLARELGFGVILDAKRGDIGSTAAAYARAYLTPGTATHPGDFEADCLTVNPFLGPDSLDPFVACSREYGKGLFILTKTSNPGSAWLQDQVIDGARVSEKVAELVASLAADTMGASGLSAVGAVVGATHPSDGHHLRTLMPQSIILSPGLGPQGGKASNLKGADGKEDLGVLFPVSRGLTKFSDLSLGVSDYEAQLKAHIQTYRALIAGE